MTHTFFKYQGTGNDFVMIDNRHQNFDKNDTKLIAHLCDRRFGIGGDGLILLENYDTSDFRMVYFNSDGNESSMCGNGGRCIMHFAHYLGIVDDEAAFMAIDGLHNAKIVGDKVHLQMQDVLSIEKRNNYVFLNTGSPHHVERCKNVNGLNVREEGSKIRYSNLYKEEGSNVNFVEKIDEITFKVRTYERGVEDETLSCGTGVTAVALAMYYIGETEKNMLTIDTKGGELSVSFSNNNGSFDDIWLIGPATQVYKGEIEW
ncbi:MAG: diaminopimelate epimerase [Bacteroidetes bacterium]|nr:MAG: diaminopimelate epimerase [Bacteroidota bacterium]